MNDDDYVADYQSLLIRTDITALKLLENDYILVAIGNILHLFSISKCEFLSKVRIFTGQKIHGIVPSMNDKLIILYGGKYLSLILYKSEATPFVLQKKFTTTTDDWILSLIWTNKSRNMALLTAHNIVQVWDTSGNLLQNYDCNVKCILYSGFLYEINSHIIVMAGTVFSQIVIWSNNDTSILQKLVGHKGVIFSISYHQGNNAIVSTSDDRSMRLWKITNDNLNDDTLEYWKSLKIESQITMFGHTARVMRNIITENNIISIGEDSLMCIWDLNGNIINKRRIHQNSCLWCIDYDIKRNVVFTGSSNSNVMMHKLRSNEAIAQVIMLPNNPKKIAFTYRGNIVCLDVQGSLVLCDCKKEEMCIMSFDMKYTDLSVSKCGQFVALFNVKGDLRIIAETCRFENNLVTCVEVKNFVNGLLSLYWLANRNIITCDKSGLLQIWSSYANRCVEIEKHILPTCREQWLTAASTLSEPKYFLIVGDRCGNIHVYDKSKIEPIQSLSKVHGTLGVNMIEVKRNEVITTGRDGTIKFFKMSKDCELLLLYCTRVSFNWVERLIGDFVCGFRESIFTMYDTKTKSNMVEIDCGGGHRSWDIKKKWSAQNVSFLQFIYVKNSEINFSNIYTEDRAMNIVDGLHAKEINAMTVLSYHNKSSNFVIISGGEDTTVKLHSCEFKGENCEIRESISVSKHLSSVKCMCVVSSMKDDRFILFTAGGRAQICTWELSLDNNLSQNLRELNNYMLRGTDFERKGKLGWRNKEIDADTETRIMCLTSFNFDSCMWLVAGCSDAYMRFFLVDDRFSNLTLKMSLKCPKCVLIVHQIFYKNHVIIITMHTDGTIFFWDIKSNFINNENLKPFHQMKVHKGGINSFDIKAIDENVYLITTGGDDNDLQVNIVSFDFNKTVIVRKHSSWSCDRYHCSQITGICILEDNIIVLTSIDQRITLLNFSYDENYTNIECKFINQYHTSISDVRGLNIIYTGRNYIVGYVFGEGIEVFKIKKC